MATDSDRLQGTWNVTSLEAEGSKVSPGMFSNSQIIISGEVFDTRAMGATFKGTFKVDESVSPRTIDILFTEGPHSGSSSLGIYELEGGAWKLCVGFAGMSRPEDFVTSAGSGHALETLSRAE